METLVFSQELTGTLLILLFTCLMLPVLYYIWVAYKRQINHWALLIGLPSFYVFGYMLSGFLLGSFAPSSLAEQIGKPAYAAVRSLIIAVSEAGGLWVTLFMLKKRFSSFRVPTGLGLGFRLFDLLILGGINSFTRLSLMLAVNKDGLDTVLKSVDADKMERLKTELTNLASMSGYTFIMSAVDYICMFVITVAVTRILWYSIEGGTRGKNSSRLFLLIGFGLRFITDMPLELYAAGGGQYKLYAAVYYILTAFAAAFAVWLSRSREDAEIIKAERLKPRIRRR
jgi:uncharacterized membrane protein YhfC